MPRSLLSNNVYRALVASIALGLLVLFAGLHAGAQQRRRLSAQPPQKKSITPLRVVETPEGSRVTITSDVPLNDYSAFRSGDRFFVMIPQADAPRLLSALRGRGFEDVQVQERGPDVVLSFRLQPGVTARVDQKFNRLEIVFTVPGTTTSAGTTRIDIKPPLITPNNTNNQNAATTGTQNSSITPPANQNATTTAGTSTRGRRGGRRNYGSWPSYTYAESGTETTTTSTEGTTPTQSATPTQTEAVTPSPIASPTLAPSVTPTEQVAQQTAPPPPQTAVTTPSNQPVSETRTLGVTLKENWLLVLLGALVLLIIGWVLIARSRGGRESETTTTERSALKDAPVEAPVTRAEAPASKAASLDEATLVAPVATVAAVEQAREVESIPATEEVESKQIEPVTAIDVERADMEVNKLLAGESHDESVISSANAGTRQIIAAGLLAALAGRNEERRERARDAFIKHDYFDEATRDLRTAEAAGERASAARSLGLTRDRAATPHLVAALEDPSPEVRRAGVEALADIRDPEALAPLESLLKREKDRKVPKGLIRRAIEASTPMLVAEEMTSIAAPAPEVETPIVETAPVVVEEGVPPVEVPASVETEEVTTETVKAPSVETAEIPSVETAVQAEALDTTPEPETAQAEASPVAAADAASDESASGLGTLAAATPIIAAGALAAEEMAARRRRAKEEEEARQRAEEEAARQRAEEERRRAEEAARLRAEEEERKRVEAEAARRRAEEEARLRAEEERKRAEEEARERAEAARLRAEEEARRQAEEEARRRRAEEEAARLRAEEEARVRAEEEARRKAEEEARLRAEEEARRAEEEAARQRAEEEARQRAEEERRRAEEERKRAEAEAARQGEEAEAARLRAEEEAERQRADAELARLHAEAEATRLRSEEELGSRQIIQPDVAASLAGQPEAAETVPTETASFDVTPEPVIERNDGTTAAGWIEVDISEPEVVRHATPIKPTPGAPVGEEKGIAEATPEPIMAEPVQEPPAFQQSVAPEVIEQPRAESATKEIDQAIVDKGIAPVGEDLSTVPSAILKRLGSEDEAERATAVADLGRLGGDDSFREITAAFDDPSQDVRNAAARSLYNLQADRAASFTRALREAPPERRRAIGAALASSGLANEAIGHLMGESRERTYDAFSLLFLMSKAGEVQPLLRAIEDHPNNEVRLAVVKLLALSGQQEILPAFRRLAVRGSLPTEVRSAVMEAIYQISSQSSPDASSAA